MNFADTFDALAEPASDPRIAKTLDRVAFGGLLLMVAAAPHSIAVTQVGWLVGMAAWIARLTVSPRPSVRIGPIGISLGALFVWSAISSAFSYEPAISLNKLRAVSVFLIFIYALNVIRNRRAVHLMAFLLIGSCMISVAWTPIQKLTGRSIQFSQLASDSPLAGKGAREGDVIVRANGRRVNAPDEVIAQFDGHELIKLEMNRLDGVFWIDLQRGDLLGGQTAADQLGISEWKHWRGFRAAGFYGHFTTYAEVLQLIGALAFGLFVAAFIAVGQIRPALALGACVAGIAFALLLTVTRASQLAFIVSSLSTALLGATRKFVLIAILIAVPLAAAGLYFLQQQRQVGFFDTNDGSIQYRLMMWRDGIRLLREDPKHLLVGVGMDAIQENWEEWGLFDKGWQPMGHFHSTPMQLAVERGILALLLWLIVLFLYAKTLWRALRQSESGDWRSQGILLGCFGSLIGFFASGLVHYNLGDQEVAMVFYFLMALGVNLAEFDPPENLLVADSPLLRANA